MGVTAGSKIIQSEFAFDYESELLLEQEAASHRQSDPIQISSHTCKRSTPKSSRKNLFGQHWPYAD